MKKLFLILIVCMSFTSCEMMNMLIDGDLVGVDPYELKSEERATIDNAFGEGYANECKIRSCSFSANDTNPLVVVGALSTYDDNSDTIYINSDFPEMNTLSVIFFEYAIRWCVKNIDRDTDGATGGLNVNSVPDPAELYKSIQAGRNYNASVEANIVNFYYVNLTGCYTSDDPQAYLEYMRSIMKMPAKEISFD